MADWGKDNYRNSGLDVLTYFLTYQDYYAVLCDGIVRRGKLSIVDSGIYRTLLREGKLEGAIPNTDCSKRRALNTEDVKK